MKASSLAAWKHWPLLTATVALTAGCASSGTWQSGPERDPASFVTPVMKMIFHSSGSEGEHWLAETLLKTGGRSSEDAARMARAVRTGLDSLTTEELAASDDVLQVLRKDIGSFGEQDFKVLDGFLSKRGASFVNCAQCVQRRQEFRTVRKMIQKRILDATQGNSFARRKGVEFNRELGVLLDKDAVAPEKVYRILNGVDADKIADSPDAVLDVIHSMAVLDGKNIDVDRATRLINEWKPDTLGHLKSLYAEAILQRAQEKSLSAEQAFERVARKYGISDESLERLKVCALAKRG